MMGSSGSVSEMNSLASLLSLLADPEQAKQQLDVLRRETDRHAAALKEALATRDAAQKRIDEAAVKEAALAEHERVLLGSAAERQRAITVVEQSLAERRTVVANREQALAEREARVVSVERAQEDRARALSARQEELDGLVNQHQAAAHELKQATAAHDRRVADLNTRIVKMRDLAAS